MAINGPSRDPWYKVMIECPFCFKKMEEKTEHIELRIKGDEYTSVEVCDNCGTVFNGTSSYSAIVDTLMAACGYKKTEINQHEIEQEFES